MSITIVGAGMIVERKSQEAHLVMMQSGCVLSINISALNICHNFFWICFWSVQSSNNILFLFCDHDLQHTWTTMFKKVSKALFSLQTILVEKGTCQSKSIICIAAGVF